MIFDVKKNELKDHSVEDLKRLKDKIVNRFQGEGLSFLDEDDLHASYRAVRSELRERGFEDI